MTTFFGTCILYLCYFVLSCVFIPKNCCCTVVARAFVYNSTVTEGSDPLCDLKTVNKSKNMETARHGVDPLSL